MTGTKLRLLSIGWLALLALSLGCAVRTPTGLDLGGGGGGGGGTGTLEIMVSTSGSNLDDNGYLLVFNENTSQPVGINGGVTLTSFAVGAYQVELADVAPNCAVQGTSATQSFSVSAGTTTTVDFDVTCT